jgi:hypothetical protein
MFGGREIAVLLDMIPIWKCIHRHILVFKSHRKAHDELGNLSYPFYCFFCLGLVGNVQRYPQLIWKTLGQDVEIVSLGSLLSWYSA